MSELTALFKPFVSPKLTLPNRIAMAPMTRSCSPGNIPNEGVVEYYRKRAAGGTGLIITEGTCVDHVAAHGFQAVPNFYGNEALAGWKAVVDAVHAEGGKIAPQLWHVGAMRAQGDYPGGDQPSHSPSGMMFPDKVTGHTMTQQDIDDVIKAFAQAASAAKIIGMDAIELHGAHGYLIDQFFWQGTNRRSDKYGGDMQGRLTFALEMLHAIRKEVGDDFPIIFRFSQWKQQQYETKLANSPAELEAFLGPLSDAGVDIFHCSQRRFWTPEFEGSDLNLAAWTKKLTGKATMSVGSVSLDQDFFADVKEGFKSANIADLKKLEELMARGDFDLIAVGRALIANPDWANLVKAGSEDQLQAFNKEMLYSLDGEDSYFTLGRK
jgi:2,4-dienoyl-CoA reductase-like NADH-dependent reductase (Old Yellow Enzyme family)